MKSTRYTRQPAHPFEFFQFANRDSIEAAKAAWRLIFRNPRSPQLFVVTGPARSGKTLFVRTIVEAAFPLTYQGVAMLPAQDCPSLDAILGESAMRGCLHLDDVQALRAGKHCDNAKRVWFAKTMQAFAGSRGWTWRRPWSTEILTAVNRCAVFVTTTNADLPNDLVRVARVITMQPFTEGRA